MDFFLRLTVLVTDASKAAASVRLSCRWHTCCISWPCHAMQSSNGLVTTNKSWPARLTAVKRVKCASRMTAVYRLSAKWSVIANHRCGS